MVELTSDRLDLRERVARVIYSVMRTDNTPWEDARTVGEWSEEYYEIADAVVVVVEPGINAQSEEIERLKAENDRLISEIKFITAPVEVGGGANAYMHAEIERLRREREVLAAAVRLREEARKASAAIPWARPGKARSAVEAAWAAKDAAEDAHAAALALLDGEKGGGEAE